MDDTKLPEKLPEIIKPRQVKLTRQELTGRNLKIITDYVENGLTYEGICSKYNIAEGTFHHILSKYCKLYSSDATKNKLKRKAFLNRKHRENELSGKELDPIKVIQELREEYEPKKEPQVNIDNRKLIINSEDLANLTNEEKLERLRRALSE